MMGPGGFGRRSLWLVFLDSLSRVTPLVVPIEDIPAEPEAEMLEGIVDVVRNLAATNDLAAVALLLSRPGPGAMSGSDRRWATALGSAFGALSPWPVHLATADRLQVFAADDLLAC
jgi:hypothetical protein